MKIAIFGDSFAANNPRNPTASWMDLLSEIHDVKNFAEQGSSLFYSVDQFLKNHHDFDKIIFVVTDVNRIYLPDHHIKDLRRHQAGLPSVERQLFQLSQLKKYNDNDLQKLKILTAVKDYFQYIQNDDYDSYVYNLMIKDILDKRPDAVLIPACSATSNFYKGKSYMKDISFKELDGWSLDINWAQTADYRHAHMSAENNAIFFRNVLKWLSGEEVNIDIDEYVQPPFQTFYITNL
jgi:hypothetical protein